MKSKYEGIMSLVHYWSKALAHIKVLMCTILALKVSISSFRHN